MKRFLLLGSLVFVALLLTGPVFAQAPQPGGSGFGGPGGPGGLFGGGGVLGLAMREEVQQELQLVDEQKDKVRGIFEDIGGKAREEMRDMFSNIRDMSDEERRAKFDEIRAKFESINADMEKELGKVLLPHQMDRLKQINLQNQVQQRGPAALAGGDLAKTLNLTDEQREKLEKRWAEVQEETQAQIRQLQADARKKVLEVLTAEQRAQLEKMMGDQFDLPEPRFDFRSRFGRSGQGGGQPGQRPSGNRPPSEQRTRTGNESI